MSGKEAQARREVIPTGDPLFARLEELARDGHVWIEGNDYVGRAADGTVVQLGNVARPLPLLAYLVGHPTSETW